MNEALLSFIIEVGFTGLIVAVFVSLIKQALEPVL